MCDQQESQITISTRNGRSTFKHLHARIRNKGTRTHTHAIEQSYESVLVYSSFDVQSDEHFYCRQYDDDDKNFARAISITHPRMSIDDPRKRWKLPHYIKIARRN